MAREGPGRREFTELVTHHVLGHGDRDVFLAVVDAERETDELRQNRRPAAPDLDDLVAARGTRLLRLLIVDRRLQILMTSLRPEARVFSAFLRR